MLTLLVGTVSGYRESLVTDEISSLSGLRLQILKSFRFKSTEMAGPHLSGPLSILCMVSH